MKVKSYENVAVLNEELSAGITLGWASTFSSGVS
jgi:hypothetical protein